MRKIFIADAHLREADAPNYRQLLRFLAGLRGTTETLYIMGDLFEFWIGYRRNPFPQYQPLLDELGLLVAGGTRLVYFEGNHDFHMGPIFKETLRAEIHRGPAQFDIDGRRVYLCHGDQINRGDIGYRLLRALLHNPLTGIMARIAGAGVASIIAERMGRASRRGHDKNRRQWDYAALLREFSAERFREGYDLVVAGHFHLPLQETSTDGSGRTLLSLGDWISHYTYGEWCDGEISLKKFI